MASDELKEMIVGCWLGRGTTEKDWKRTSKKTMGPDKVEVRTFENKNTGNIVWTFGDADDECMHPGGEHLFFLGDIEGELTAAFNPLSYWLKEKCLWDQHCGFQVMTVYDLPDWMTLDEVCENNFVVEFEDGKTVDDVKDAFIKAGLKFDQEFHDFMIRHQ